MTPEELKAKLTPGEPRFDGPDDHIAIPSGNADGVLYFKGTGFSVRQNGQTIWKTTAQSKEERALCYLRRLSADDRRAPDGTTHLLGVSHHFGEFKDVLYNYNRALFVGYDTKDIENLMVADYKGTNALRPEFMPHWKVYAVEEGVWAIVFDKE